ncbi:MAG: hypothetical protein CMJ52_00190 [Planctomycetaceae bacterium]|nr:hypothetical protein [Planctomycetaceae bacterium]
MRGSIIGRSSPSTTMSDLAVQASVAASEDSKSADRRAPPVPGSHPMSSPSRSKDEVAVATLVRPGPRSVRHGPRRAFPSVDRRP